MVADPANAAVSRNLVGKHSAEVLQQVGAWRWPLVSKHRDRILELIKQDYVIDFGGSAGPIGYGSLVVDRQSHHVGLDDVPGDADCIFTSHTLEHVVDLRCCLAALFAKLRLFGHLIVHVPSFANAGLRAENWPHHGQTFCFEGDDCKYVKLDIALKRAAFRIETTDRGGGNLFVIARKL